MTKRWWVVVGLWLWLAVVLVAGCAAEGAYRSPASAEASNSALPPALSGTDPALRHWYTAPYFDPYEMP
jgi:hypothetical protein